jgi:hypothetical protein
MGRPDVLLQDYWARIRLLSQQPAHTGNLAGQFGESDTPADQAWTVGFHIRPCGSEEVVVQHAPE